MAAHTSIHMRVPAPAPVPALKQRSTMGCPGCLGGVDCLRLPAWIAQLACEAAQANLEINTEPELAGRWSGLHSAPCNSDPPRRTHRYGTMQAMWSGLLDLDRSGRVSAAEFRTNVRRLGYDCTEEIEELFHLLLVREGTVFLSFEDVAFLQGWQNTKEAQAPPGRLRGGGARSSARMRPLKAVVSRRKFMCCMEDADDAARLQDVVVALAELPEAGAVVDAMHEQGRQPQGPSRTSRLGGLRFHRRSRRRASRAAGRSGTSARRTAPARGLRIPTLSESSRRGEVLLGESMADLDPPRRSSSGR